MVQPQKPRPSLLLKAKKAGKLLEAGVSLLEIVRRLKVTPTVVQGWQAYYGWQLPPAPPTQTLLKKLALEERKAARLLAPPTKAAIYRQAQGKKKTAREKEHTAVKEMIAAGWSYATIRCELNLSYYTFYSHLKSLQLPVQPERSPEPTPEERQAYIDHVYQQWLAQQQRKEQQQVLAEKKWTARQLCEQQGMELKDIAAQVQVSTKTMTAWKTAGNWKTAPTKKHKEARQLYESGLQQKEIAAQLHVSEKTVSKWKRQNKWQRPCREPSPVKEPAER